MVIFWALRNIDFQKTNMLFWMDCQCSGVYANALKSKWKDARSYSDPKYQMIQVWHSWWTPFSNTNGHYAGHVGERKPVGIFWHSGIWEILGSWMLPNIYRFYRFINQPVCLLLLLGVCCFLMFPNHVHGDPSASPGKIPSEVLGSTGWIICFPMTRVVPIAVVLPISSERWDHMDHIR